MGGKGKSKGKGGNDDDSDDEPPSNNKAGKGGSKGAKGSSKGGNKPDDSDSDDGRKGGSKGGNKGGGKGGDRGSIGKGSDGKSKGKDDGKGGKGGVQFKGKGKSNEGGDFGKDGKGKKGKKGKGRGKDGKGKFSEEFMMRRRKKKLRKQVEAIEDLDFDLPKLTDRISTANQDLIQGAMDPKKLKELRDAAIKRNKEVKALNDAATYKRAYKCHLSVTAIQNMTDRPWETFMAVSMIKAGSSANTSKKLKASYSYSRSYNIPAGEKKKFKVAEKVYTKMFTGSYKDLQLQELRMDLWIVVKRNFNQHLGTATRNLYECGTDAVYQTCSVKGVKQGSHQALSLGTVFLSAMVSEVFTFNILLQNWSFMPPALKKETGTKSLCFSVPSGTGAKVNSETAPTQGPRYQWKACGQFRYDGTKVSLSQASFDVMVHSNGGLQGKSVISLGGAGDFPICTGNVKCMTDNVAQFDQGKVVGGINMTTKSKLLEDGVIDAEPSIPAPMQPGASVVMYNLDPNVQYLLVDVSSAEGLPVADFDLGTSHPFCRIRYDGVIQQTPVVEGTLRPVWNHLFYMPVRYIEPDIRTNPRYRSTILQEELKSKGFLEVEVWHMDGVPTEFLGSFRLDPRMTRFGNDEERSVCEKMAKLMKASDEQGGEDHEEEDDGPGKKQAEEETQGIHPKLMKKHKTKVFIASRQKLTGCRLQVQTQPKISFECYFVPDFPDDVTFPEQPSEKGIGAVFAELIKNWDENQWTSHNFIYYAWYPDAPPERAFPCSYIDMRGQALPLPYLICPLALPASLSQPGDVMHWIRCLEFLVPTKQRSKGKIDKWQGPEATLSLRKGSTQDHAVLLCCALKGLGKDAWVAKGTVHGNQEHCWCLTREKGGCVTFWETSTGAKYHLPTRWSDDPARQGKMLQVVKQRNQAEKRSIRPDYKTHAQVRKDGGRREQCKDMDDLPKLPFSPYLGLVKPDKIVPLPYQSIECVFNDDQLYGNKGNHNPACIYYDFEMDTNEKDGTWLPFMDKKHQQRLAVNKGTAIPVGPAISSFTATELGENIDKEIKESISMTRIRKGFESAFEDADELREVLIQYLDVLEEEIKLDIDWRIDPKGKNEKPPGHPSPFNSAPYVESARKCWRKYWELKTNLDSKRMYLPVRENHILSGVPFHFSGTDIKEVRYHIMDCKAVVEYLSIPTDDVVYFVASKVFPMANSVASVWCWIGVQMKLSQEDIFELASEQEKEKATGKTTGAAASAASSQGKGNAKAAPKKEPKGKK